MQTNKEFSDLRVRTWVDGWIFFATAALLAVGITIVLSTSYLYGIERFSDGVYFFRMQFVAAGLGLVLLLISALLPTSVYRRSSYPLLILSLVLSGHVLFPELSVQHEGSQRWFYLTSSVGFKSAELTKLSFVLYLANYLAKKKNKMSQLYSGVLPPLTVGLLFMTLLLFEPDFGTSLLLAIILFLMLFVAGVNLLHLLIASLLITTLITLLAVGPDYPLIQSYIAFASGGVWGRGLGESRQKIFYPRNAHTDLIFSIIGEEMGLLGALAVLALFIVIMLRGLRIAATANEPFYRYLAFGVTNLIGMQALMHMGAVMRILPTTGVVLPFISYGGTALVVNLIEIGILLNLSRKESL